MNNPAVFGFYGKSNTGKTSLLVRAIKQLTDEGFKVATIKITDKLIGVDTEGKDTWNHSQAGSTLVVLSSPTETDFMFKEPQDINYLLQHIREMGEYDIVLVEGAHDPFIPKIRLGDITERENTILTYNRDFGELIKLIKNEISGRKDMEKISVKVNGKQIPVSEFPSDIIKNAVCGMLKSLKAVDEIKDVEIRFEM